MSLTMSKPVRVRLLKSAMLLAFTTLSALAVAADPPARVGRVALTQGQVSIGGDVGAEMSPAQVNWPVTSGNMLTTAPGARTELRIGSTSIRLDGDSSLEVVELDDDNIRLRLHYGSASVRILNADVLRGFELITPQARVRLQQPGRVRVDAERVRDTSAVSVFDGLALVEAGGAQLTVRAGKRAEVDDGDMRTAGISPDAFDRWSAARDKLEDKVASTRYVTAEMTGYEDLDHYGSWQQDAEYGPLWTPTVTSSWVPYRDGSWTWVEPWGWTWVDNAPWGYAPFHYGRWVYVHRHWAWAPGSRAEHLVWSPALVGWVGGAGWNLTFRDRSHRPGTGWYPLSPHDRYVPSYHASEEHLRWLNSHVRPDPHRGRDYRPQGLTVVPQDQFRPGGRVNVPRAPIATAPPPLAHNGMPLTTAPPAPPDRPHRSIDLHRVDRNHDGRPDRIETSRFDRDGDGRPDRIEAGRFDRNRDGRPDRIETARADRDGFARQHPQPQAEPVRVQQQAPGLVPMPVPAQPQPVVSPTPHMSPAPQPIVSPTPHVSPPPQPLTANSPGLQAPGGQGWQRQERRDWEEVRRERRDGRDGRDGDDGHDGHRDRHPAPTPAPVSTVAPSAQVQPVMMAPRPAPQAMPQPAPAPVARPAPPSQQQAGAAPRPAPARSDEHRGDEHRSRSDDKRQQDR